MASEGTPVNHPADSTAEELTAKAAQKRYETLLTVRAKAIKGKGAWYWAHLEPILVHNPETGLPNSVKLRCSLCDALFSASNPSRTATEHLKRGTCPNFTSNIRPISSISPLPSIPSSSSSPHHHHNHRKRSFSPATAGYHVSPLSVVDPSRFSSEFHHQSNPDVVTPALSQHPLMLSGGKEDLDALAMLEDSVKKLKSPKMSPGPPLTRPQIDAAMDSLSDWVFESFGSVAFSTLEHPKFKAFLTQLGLPLISSKDLSGTRLDSKFEEAKAESEVRIRDAMFFQIGSDGWKGKHFGFLDRNSMTGLVKLTLNLPNGTSVFRRAVFTNGFLPLLYTEQVVMDTIKDICRNDIHQCVGVVSDRPKAMKNLENHHHWMVNLSCQLHGLISLVKDFTQHLPLIKVITEKSRKIANFMNSNFSVRQSFLKYQIQEYGRVCFLHLPSYEFDRKNFGPVYGMLEEILSSSRALQMVQMDEVFKLAITDDSLGHEVAEMIRDSGFWSELEAVHSLMKLIKDMAEEIEAERPLVGQCLLLWDAIRAKVKGWCSKFRIPEGPVEEVIDKRFRKNYHPAWAAAFVLDPLYLMKDNSGKYLPPFRCLTIEQDKDVDRLVTRLVSREEAHIALMELMKWRTEGLDPVYARAVQMKERDPATGKMKIANPQSSRLVWETYLTDFRLLGKVAVRLIFLHATACTFKCNLSFMRSANVNGESKEAIEKAEKMIFITAHSKLERRDFSSEEEKDARLFASECDEALRGS